jgi:hypothetical protein
MTHPTSTLPIERPPGTLPRKRALARATHDDGFFRSK